MPLNDMLIRAAKPREKDWKLADEKGLYLLVTTKSAKLWRVKFRHLGVEKKLSLGAYPEISLKDARRLRDDARRRLAEGVDPAREKQASKVAAMLGGDNSFDVIVDEYIAKVTAEGLAHATLTKARWFQSLLKPAIGGSPIAEITPKELLAALKKIETAGHRETARRLRSFASRVFRYAVATGRASADPAQPLRGALIAPVAKHYAAITDRAELGRLLRAIEGYSGEPVTLAALRLTPHVFQRPGEVRQMQWAEVDFERAVWTIPASRMKQRQPHAVPLSRQTVAILKEIGALTGSGQFVFPSLRSRERPMSENTINGALRRLGYSGSEMTAHGFRSTASSLLNESGKWNPDAIERALAHRDTNQVRAAYHRSAYWEERVKMAQWWSDLLVGLREGATVVEISSHAIGNG
jgi:integrase